MVYKNASEFTGVYISKTHHLPSRQDVWDAAMESTREQLTSHNSDYAKCSEHICKVFKDSAVVTPSGIERILRDYFA